MLNERRVRALDQQGECTARLPAIRKLDRFRAGNLSVAFAHNLAPAAHDRVLDKAEASERLSADFANEVSRGPCAAASWCISLICLLLRHMVTPCHSEFVTANAAQRLIQHYVDNFRRLPWRSPPGDLPQDPYRVWLSEIMLQQTTVATVTQRFDRFVSRWPTIERLAAASDEEILSEWAGLGYYARARNLIACARELARLGSFPTTAAKLRELPGIGCYTSAAIAAIAFNEKAPAVDTNVERVMARFHGLAEPSRRTIEQLTLGMMPDEAPGDFVQALMDLGATTCRPRKPRCGQCPLADDCAAFGSGEPEAFPRRHPKPTNRPHRYGIAHWIERGDRIWLVRRPDKGLLGGMTALPGNNWTKTEASPQYALGVVRHAFTHFLLELHVVSHEEPEGEGWWQPLDRIGDVGLPTLYRKAIEAALSGNDRTVP